VEGEIGCFGKERENVGRVTHQDKKLVRSYEEKSQPLDPLPIL
jgi:hypothetical protein